MTKKLSPEKRISDILDAAVQEFLEKGYENASMDRMAARAGLTKGGLYHHFASKDEILLQANERFMAPVRQMMEHAMAASSPIAGLRHYINAYVSFWSTHTKELAFVFLSLTKAMQSSSAWPLYQDYRVTMVGFFEGMAKRAIEQGEVQITDPTAWALGVFAALDGVLAYVAMDKNLPAEQTARQLCSVFINAFLAPKSDQQRPARPRRQADAGER